jgi:hypothetical protein
MTPECAGSRSSSPRQATHAYLQDVERRFWARALFERSTCVEGGVAEAGLGRHRARAYLMER